MAQQAPRRSVAGFVFSLVALASSLVYCASEIAHVLGWLHQPYYDILVFGSSIFIALPFVVAMTALYHVVPREKRFWIHSGLMLGVIYATLVSLVYFVQLAVTIPAQMSGHEAQVRFLLYYADRSFMAAIDGLGYICLALAMLFAAPAFASDGLEGWLKRFLVANGFVAPIILLVVFRPEFLLCGTVWMVTEPGALALIALYFAQRNVPRL